MLNERSLESTEFKKKIDKKIHRLKKFIIVLKKLKEIKFINVF